MNKRSRRLSVLLSSTALLWAFHAFAHQGAPPLSQRQRVQPLQAVRQLVAPPTDARAELAAELRAPHPGPARFAIATPVQITPLTDGTWEDVPGGRLWRLRIVSAGATDLNFGFSTCWLPEGATLHISSEDGNYFQGPYLARDNKPHGELWTPVVPGSRAVIEMFVPATATQQPQLLLSSVNRGFRDLFHRDKGDTGTAKAGSCNIDVVCPVAAAWSNEIRSVARYSLSGIGLCTGTLINDAVGDFRPFFLTANHCEISPANAASIVVYWNYQSPSCGQHGGGSLAQNQSGATFRMSKTDVDVTLIELDEIPDSSFQVYYSGWDRSGTAPVGAVGIHHPNGDEKSISFANSTLTTVDSCIGNGAATHWRVVWSSGVTEPGSSGSGIWDPGTHRLVGTLSGGDSSCASPQGPDCYGKFSLAWNSGGSSATRLRDWLDPSDAAVSVPGRDPATAPVLLLTASSLVSEGCLPANGAIDPGEAVTVGFGLKNIGGSNALNLVATLLATNGITSPGLPQSYGIVASGGPVVTRNFSFVATGLCADVISPTLRLQDGTNDLGAVSFALRLGHSLTVLTQNFDSVSVPTLPGGWTNAASGASTGWSTVASASDSAPNSVFAGNPGAISDSTLTSPSIAIATSSARVTFRHRYDTEEGFDGGVMEISYNGGPFNDIIAAGGSFVTGPYNLSIDPDYQSPIRGQDAWTGNSGGFITTTINLPITAAGQNVQLRWRMASDTSVSAAGWYVDSISISDGYACCQGIAAPQIVRTHQANSTLVFSFDTTAGVNYVTEFKDALGTNLQWAPLQTNLGDGSMKSITNVTAGTSNGFFRVRTQ